jgi:Uncharacterized protein conserved in bacteria
MELDMAKVKIKDAVSDILEEFLANEGLELYNVEFIKEAKDWFLRVYIDKIQDPSGEEQYVGTDDCEKVSRYLSEKLDDDNIIEQKYYLEVSSPGMDRELITDAHYHRFTGRRVEVKLYKAIDGAKTVNGELLGIGDAGILVKDENDKIWTLPKDTVAKTKLAVIF